MSDDPNAWTPIHHFEADEDGEPKKPEGQAVSQSSSSNEGGKRDKAQSPVGLMLTLPVDFVSAVWGLGDQIRDMTEAVRENTQAVLKLIDATQKPRE